VAALVALAPHSAWAEHGTELSRWQSSSPAQQYGAEPAAKTDAAKADASPATVSGAEPKKEEKVSAGSAVLTPEQLAKLQGFFFSASVDQYMGLGTLVDPAHYANIGTWVNAFISYRKRIMGHSFSLGVQPFGLTGITYEYTMPDNPTGRRVVSSDARMSLSMPALYKSAFSGVTVTPSVNLTFPTTPESWHAGLITRVGVGLSMDRVWDIPMGQLETYFSGIGSFGIFTRTANVTPAVGAVDQDHHHIDLGRPGEIYSDNAGNNPAIAAQASLGVTWLATSYFFVSTGYTIIGSWRYPVTNMVDQYTAMCSTTTGQSCANAGMTLVPLQSASVSVAVNLSDVMSLSAYIYNYAPLWSPAQNGVRNPWVDATGLPNNNTIVGLSLAATY
jgi:hypothetical protein